MRSIKSQRDAHCEEVIIYQELIGDGKDDPYRHLIVVRRKDGSFIAERDVYQEQHEDKEK